MDILTLAKQRFSLRAYSKQQVEEVKLQKILEAAQMAPTAHNNQPQRIKLITSKEDLEKVDKATPCRFGAPCVFLVCYDRSLSWKRSFDGRDSGYVDASIVATHMMLVAESLGLGSCWVMHFDPEKIIELFELSNNYEPVALLTIGYADEGAKPSESHSIRNSIDDMLF